MLKLYPIERFTANNFSSENFALIDELRQANSQKIGENQPLYVVYHYHGGLDEKAGFDVILASPAANGVEPFDLNDDRSNYETFRTDTEFLNQTRERVIARSKQGLLLRAFINDFEVYQVDNRVEIFISVRPHC